VGVQARHGQITNTASMTDDRGTDEDYSFGILVDFLQKIKTLDSIWG